jgi:hypothetical protein
MPRDLTIGRDPSPEPAIVDLLARALRDHGCWQADVAQRIPQLVDAAGAHGVSAILFTRVERADRDSWADLRDALRPQVRSALAREILVQLELARVLPAFGAAGVRVLLIKGAALAYSSYDEPWHRARTDTDLIVRLDDVDRASQLLVDAGYRKSDLVSTGSLVSHQIAFERTDARGMRHVLDLHWKIVNPQMLADAMSFEDLWRDARPARGLSDAARVPSPVASLMLAAVHRLAHHQGHDRLIWLYDLRVLSRAFSDRDWHTLEESARRHRVAGLCLDGLQRARALVGAVLPERTEASLAAAAPDEASRVYVDGRVNRRQVLLNDLASLTRWRDRMRLLREHAFPSPAFIRQRYGVRARVLLPALYVHRLVSGAVKWVRP